jgi:peptidyl-prolyl cis-trans isomerase B (cyclophilin B)
MGKNSNYKYNAFAERDAAIARAARRKKRNAILISVAAVLLVVTLVIVATIIWYVTPKDYCFYYRNREFNEDKVTYVEIKVENYDAPIVLLLDASEAKVTVENFVALVERGFYDGLDFHRVIKGFMIQGGDASHLPAEEQAESIIGEFSANGISYNDFLHKRGVISMARATDKNSASSGFFICDADTPRLDGQYAAFGYVISGLFTVDAIADYAVGKTDSNGNILNGYEQPKIEYIKVLDGYDGK